MPAVGGNSVRISTTTQMGPVQRYPSDFRGRCVEKLEKLGDTAMDSNNYDKAIKEYSDAFTLNPMNQRDILKRSKVRVVMGS